MEGWDTYPTGNIVALSAFPWQALGSVSSVLQVVTAGARNGRACFENTANTGSNPYIRRPFTGDPAFNYIGCAINIQFIDSQSGGFGFEDSSGNRHYFTVDGSGFAAVGTNTGLNFTTATQLLTATWYFVELIYNHTTKNTNLYVNGQLAGAGAVTGLAASAPVNVYIGRTSSSNWRTLAKYDDFFAVAGNSTVLSDVAIATLVPDADEAPQDWTPSIGTDGFAVIDDLPYNDATFIEAANSLDVSRFALIDAPPNTFQVHAIQTQYRAQKTSASIIEIEMSIISGTGSATGPTRSLNTTPDTYSEAYALNPATGLPFTPAELNTLRIEIERV